MRSIKLTAKSTTESFNPESKLYQAQSIEIFPSDHTFPAFLRHFKGKQAFISCLTCDVLDLIEFVKKWKPGEAFRALEYLKIGVYEGRIPQNQVMQEIGAKAIDATKQPAAYTLRKLYDWEDLGPNTDPIISHSYVVRESDNRVASVLIEEDTLSFGVWDKTEEEFSRMMD
ncbi:Protein CBG00658 [Caenorhabditis briggsae]|uniref:Protein CBG00658 n=1 Tax=Caenorhabditis briggsae TaxID=6238 RepID=A8WNC7_CAEBR|nr:Protein CBG00658 [Caenorhabditis briggsae]CAP21981.1 Protein CBG00658 [Caenorhabditis briggsae]